MRRILFAVILCVVALGQSAVQASSSQVLVTYFSATGNTRKVAEEIVKTTGADLFEILPKERYTAVDLDYNSADSRVTKEHNNRSIRSAVVGVPKDLKRYKTVFVGYPIWWGEAPNIMATFLTSCDLIGKRVIPFCTSYSSPVGNSDKQLHQFVKGAKWDKGVCFNVYSTDKDIVKWLHNIGF